jgi:hypothetical protein
VRRARRAAAANWMNGGQRDIVHDNNGPYAVHNIIICYNTRYDITARVHKSSNTERTVQSIVISGYNNIRIIYTRQLDAVVVVIPRRFVRTSYYCYYTLLLLL